MGVFNHAGLSLQTLPWLRTMFARVLRSPITRQLAFQRSVRFNSDALGLDAAPLHATKPTITIVDGDGIGPELMDSVVGVLSAAEVPITWERFSTQGDNELDIDELIISLSSNRVGLKGPLYTPVHGKASRNMRIRRAIDLFANVVPIRNIPGIETRHKDVDFVVIRENTEGEYSGLEHLVAPGVVQSLKVITRSASLRIARFAFQYAVENGRQKVTAIHKANIQKLSDGEFLACCRAVAEEFPGIAYEEMIIDNASMQMVMNPQQFDVVLTPNLYGAILQNVGSGLVGGPGIHPGSNVGIGGHAMFESGMRHVGLDIKGKGVSNPTGSILTSVMMLRHMKMNSFATRIEEAVFDTIKEKQVRTRDIGGSNTTREVTKAVIDKLI